MRVKMLSILFSLISLVKTDATANQATNYVQTLVFEKTKTINNDYKYFCRFRLEPRRTVENVAIFLQTGGVNNAVAKATVTPTPDKSTVGFQRVDIPDVIEKNGSKYNFKFEIDENTVIFSQDWTWDKNKKEFALCTAVKDKFYQKNAFIITMGSLAVVVLMGGLFFIYRKIRRSKSSL